LIFGVRSSLHSEEVGLLHDAQELLLVDLAEDITSLYIKPSP
jgi:hypothetical protein